ncbi:MAG: 4-(cytidine 5'-diphospho)-2-C-methyl-D-erythritol kinase [Planctomycetes bacterium]|nr:4-(cytidine 5'-diphospho)-2-C-methyl-D-erythritol kinase [Planctomycetota bacterium]
MTGREWWWMPARAKLNLVLRVVGRRADGYHLLETLFHALELHDDLALALAPKGIDLVVTADEPSLQLPPGTDNLVAKALRALAAATGYGGGFEVRLHKRIPHGGGLGGGSSDAAAALRLANERLGLPLAAPALAALAVRLGADVPFFLHGGSMWGRGIGDELTPATVPSLAFVLVVPPYGCDTKAVYENHAALWRDRRPQVSVRAHSVSATRDTVRIDFGNELEPAAARVRPAMVGLRDRIVAAGHADVHMSGSGSTWFVPCVDAEASARCLRDLEPLRADGVRLVATRSAAANVDVPLAGLPEAAARAGG